MDNNVHDEYISMERIKGFLRMLDEYCVKESIKGYFLIVGGAAATTLLDGTDKDFRMTRDIDVAGVTFTDDAKVREFLKNMGTDLSVDYLLFPPSDEILESDEIMEIKGGYRNIEVYVPTPEMFVCIKSFAGRVKDYYDIIDSGILELCDIKKVIGLIKEYTPYLLNPESMNSHHEEILEKLEEMEKS